VHPRLHEPARGLKIILDLVIGGGARRRASPRTRRQGADGGLQARCSAREVGTLAHTRHVRRAGRHAERHVTALDGSAEPPRLPERGGPWDGHLRDLRRIRRLRWGYGEGSARDLRIAEETNPQWPPRSAASRPRARRRRGPRARRRRALKALPARSTDLEPNDRELFSSRQQRKHVE